MLYKDYCIYCKVKIAIIIPQGVTKFCSSLCYHRFLKFYGGTENRVKRICTICGKLVFLPEAYSETVQQPFCSNVCKKVYYNQHRVEKSCLLCNKKFFVDLNYSNQGGGKFCSSNCWRKYQKENHIIKVCCWCKKSFDTNGYARKDGEARKYCSLKCYEQYRTERKKNRFLRVCKQCNNEFFGRTRAKLFCSHTCFRKFNNILPGKQTVVCKVCEKKIEVWGARAKKQKYCSIECSLKEWVKRQQIKPNKMELQLKRLIDEVTGSKEYHLNVLGDVIIDRKIPDFINVNGQKKIIELFGEHVHPVADERERKEVFSKFGYKTLIVWSKELRDEERVREKIRDFHVIEG